MTDQTPPAPDPAPTPRRGPPLSSGTYGELGRILRTGPIPCQTVNPGSLERLRRDGFVEVIQARSPFEIHRGRDIDHVRVTDTGTRRFNQGLDFERTA